MPPYDKGRCRLEVRPFAARPRLYSRLQIPIQVSGREGAVLHRRQGLLRTASQIERAWAVLDAIWGGAMFTARTQTQYTARPSRTTCRGRFWNGPSDRSMMAGSTPAGMAPSCQGGSDCCDAEGVPLWRLVRIRCTDVLRSGVRLRCFKGLASIGMKARKRRWSSIRHLLTRDGCIA